jgi:cupin 2 domain-containing protein
MTVEKGNLFAGLPGKAPAEIFDSLLDNGHFRLERIVSTGQATPEGEWYDQDEDEWVVLLKGRAALRFDGETYDRVLEPGDWLAIPAHRRHRVQWTATDETTVWLALHFA